MSDINRAQINLIMYEGAAFEQDFVWETGVDEASAVGVDLTGWSAVMDIRATPKTAPLLRLTIANSKLIFADQVTDLGGYGIRLLSADSQGWCPAHEDVRAVYDLFLIDPGGVRRSHQYGELKIEAAISRPWET